MLLTVGLALLAQGSLPRSESGRSLDERIAVIETKLDNLKTLDDRVSKLSDKVDTMRQQLTVLDTKMSLVLWIGGVIGTLLLGGVWNLFTKLSALQEGAIRRAVENFVIEVGAPGVKMAPASGKRAIDLTDPGVEIGRKSDPPK